MPKGTVGRDLTAERLRELFHYDPETGAFTWKMLTSPRGGVKIGDVAGSIDTKGYRIIRIDGRDHKAHRLAWLYMIGEWPKDQVDHRNGTPADNRFANLREATRAENGQNRATSKNNTSGFTGVSWHGRDRKWRAQIRAGGRNQHLGMFASAEDAHAAYLAAKAELHPFQPIPRGAD